MPREALLARTLVQLADSLVDDFDVVELLSMLTDRCVEVIGASAAGIMLVLPDGELGVMASSSESMRVLELFELQCQEGPCLDCYRTGEPIINEDVRPAQRWPRFSAECVRAGFQSVHAVPMRLRGTTIGALNLFQNDHSELTADDIAAAQALADVATIAIIQHRAVKSSEAVIEELQHALNSRVKIEQAKGVLATRAKMDVDSAFQLMRTYARNHSVLLVSVADQVIRGELGPTEFNAS